MTGLPSQGNRVLVPQYFLLVLTWIPVSLYEINRTYFMQVSLFSTISFVRLMIRLFMILNSMARNFGARLFKITNAFPVFLLIGNEIKLLSNWSFVSPRPMQGIGVSIIPSKKCRCIFGAWFLAAWRLRTHWSRRSACFGAEIGDWLVAHIIYQFFNGAKLV